MEEQHEQQLMIKDVQDDRTKNQFNNQLKLDPTLTLIDSINNNNNRDPSLASLTTYHHQETIPIISSFTQEQQQQQQQQLSTDSYDHDQDQESIIIPVHPILFPELLEEDQHRFNDSSVSFSPPQPALVISIGTIPSPSITQTGKPFDEDDVDYFFNQPPQDQQVTLDECSRLDHHHDSKPDLSDGHQAEDLIKAEAQQKVAEIRRTSSTTTAEGPAPAPPSRPILSSMSRIKEPWLNDLKLMYSNMMDTNTHLQTILKRPPTDKNPYSYPDINDSFPSIEKFKEACLLASWAGGHDMHVRNHYKTDLWERCVFTCRYDRSPPKGFNCPFKIVALGDKTKSGESSGTIKAWQVIKVHLSHRNHELYPGAYDPLGKRAYRKRKFIEGEEDHPGSSPQTAYPRGAEPQIAPKKRGRPAIHKKKEIVDLAGGPHGMPKLNMIDPSLDPGPAKSTASTDAPIPARGPEEGSANSSESQSESEEDEGSESRGEKDAQWPTRPFGSLHTSDPGLPRPRRSLAKYQPIPLDSLRHLEPA